MAIIQLHMIDSFAKSFINQLVPTVVNSFGQVTVKTMCGKSIDIPFGTFIIRDIKADIANKLNTQVKFIKLYLAGQEEELVDDYSVKQGNIFAIIEEIPPYSYKIIEEMIDIVKDSNKNKDTKLNKIITNFISNVELWIITKKLRLDNGGLELFLSYYKSHSSKFSYIISYNYNINYDKVYIHNDKLKQLLLNNWLETNYSKKWSMCYDSYNFKNCLKLIVNYENNIMNIYTAQIVTIFNIDDVNKNHSKELYGKFIPNFVSLSQLAVKSVDGFIWFLNIPKGELNYYYRTYNDFIELSKKDDSIKFISL